MDNPILKPIPTLWIPSIGWQRALSCDISFAEASAHFDPCHSTSCGAHEKLLVVFLLILLQLCCVRGHQLTRALLVRPHNHLMDLQQPLVELGTFAAPPTHSGSQPEISTWSTLTLSGNASGLTNLWMLLLVQLPPERNGFSMDHTGRPAQEVAPGALGSQRPRKPPPRRRSLVPSRSACPCSPSCSTRTSSPHHH